MANQSVDTGEWLKKQFPLLAAKCLDAADAMLEAYKQREPSK